MIQASAADMTKQAMVNLYNQGITPLLQIHDELDCSVKDIAAAQEIARSMETALELRVPSKCDIDLGPSWGEAKEVKYV